MPYHPSTEEWKKLKAIGSVPMWSKQQGVSTCTFLDTTTKKVWHSATVGDEKQSFQEALRTATNSEQPKTTAQLAEENKEAAQKIADLKKEVDELKPAATRKRRRSTKSKPTETKTDEPDTDLDT
jgi:hypothetical protein